MVRTNVVAFRLVQCSGAGEEPSPALAPRLAMSELPLGEHLCLSPLDR